MEHLITSFESLARTMAADERFTAGWIGTLFPEVDLAPFEEKLARFELRAAALGY